VISCIATRPTGRLKVMCAIMCATLSIYALCAPHIVGYCDFVNGVVSSRVHAGTPLIEARNKRVLGRNKTSPKRRVNQPANYNQNVTGCHQRKPCQFVASMKHSWWTAARVQRVRAVRFLDSWNIISTRLAILSPIRILYLIPCIPCVNWINK